MKLSSLDLNLLLVFHAVHEAKSVVDAARRLALTPPAVSNALARLRTALGDPLFVRSGRGLVATPRAVTLGPFVAKLLAELDAELFAQGFEPETSTREFTLALADSDQIARLPKLTAGFLRALPRARLRAISIDALLSFGGLGAGQVDFAIAPSHDEPGLHALALYAEDAVLLVRRDHPLLARRRSLTRELFCSLRHVDTHIALGRPGSGHRAASDALSAHGLVRDVALTVPTFAAAAMVASHTDLVAALPRSVARAFAQFSPVRVLELPGPPLRMPLHLVWHERTHADPGARFVRGLIARTLGSKAHGAHAATAPSRDPRDASTRPRSHATGAGSDATRGR